MIADLAERVGALLDAATHRIANVLANEGCDECGGALAVPTGVTYAGHSEMGACPSCYGLAHRLVLAAYGIEDES